MPEIDKASYDYYKITLYISISKDLVLYNCTAKQRHVTGRAVRDWSTLILVAVTTRHVVVKEGGDWAFGDVPRCKRAWQALNLVKVESIGRFKIKIEHLIDWYKYL